MSTSSQPKAASDNSQDSEQTQARSPATAIGSGEVMPWPKQNQRQNIVVSRAELLFKRQAVVLRVLADFGSEASLQPALMATVNTIKHSLSAVRVSIGLLNRRGFKIAAISQQANVDARTSESELLCAAMQEALDKDDIIATSTVTLGEPGMQAHRLLCAGRPDRQIVSVPVCHAGECIAVICIERDVSVPMANSTIALVRQTADLLAPLIVSRQNAERTLASHAQDSLLGLVDFMSAPRHMKWKIAGLLLCMCLIVSSFWPATHWVVASAELVPLDRRVIAAPREGYIHSVDTSSGSQVTAGELLLMMDTSDLDIELSRWQSELNALSTEMRAAMAVADRRKMTMLSAEIDKTRAQFELATTQLQRSEIRAPLDGVVVSGDLSQMVGAPVSRGQLLVELAPEQGYEVHLMVDEREINHVDVDDPARLQLRAGTSTPLELVIEKIHPIGVAEDGANRFRVIASVASNTQQLLPGQTGIGKINVGSASMLWIISEDFVGWLKLKRWEWFG